MTDTGPDTAGSAAKALSEALAWGDFEVAARDRSLLLAHAAGVEAPRLMMLEAADFTAALMTRYGALLARRAGGEPVSKIIRKRAFWNHDFLVTPDVLDPRPDTETLVAKALEAPFADVLDLGTGTGCILLSLLAERPDARGAGVDISAAALDVARRNAEAIGVAARCRFVQSDWFSALSGRFDLITSNPPYITEDEMADLAPEVRDHDPHLALTPGGDGLAPYRILAAQAAGFLHPDGRIIVEMGWRQGPDVARIFRDHGWRAVEILPDLEGRDRIVAARAPQDQSRAHP